MKNTFGSSVTLTLFGESHGPAIGAVLDGLAPGLEIDEGYIARRMSLRRAVGKISTPRREEDRVEFLSGVFNGKTTGTPLCLIIKNNSAHSGDYDELRSKARPGHADYTGFVKYGGFADHRGGGHFSGRLTAPLVAAGAVLSYALEKKGILIGSHIAECAGIRDDALTNPAESIPALNEKSFAVLNDAAGEKMKAAVEKASAEGDSVGGIIETAAVGVPAGLGEPWFDTAESLISHAVFSVPAVKGIEFGDGFRFAAEKGSEANDPFEVRDGKIRTVTNRNGGINGGITNGADIIFRTVIKPTPSISLRQRTADILKNENCEIEIKGRHDPCIVHRARVVIDSVTALVIADLLAQRYGTNWPGVD